MHLIKACSKTHRKGFIFVSPFFSERPAFRKMKYSSYLAAILDDVIGPHGIQQKIISILYVPIIVRPNQYGYRIIGEIVG